MRPDVNLYAFAGAALTITGRSQSHRGFVSLQGVPPQVRPSVQTGRCYSRVKRYNPRKEENQSPSCACTGHDDLRESDSRPPFGDWR